MQLVQPIVSKKKIQLTVSLEPIFLVTNNARLAHDRLALTQ